MTVIRLPELLFRLTTEIPLQHFSLLHILPPLFPTSAMLNSSQLLRVTNKEIAQFRLEYSRLKCEAPLSNTLTTKVSPVIMLNFPSTTPCPPESITSPSHQWRAPWTMSFSPSVGFTKQWSPCSADFPNSFLLLSSCCRSPSQPHDHHQRHCSQSCKIETGSSMEHWQWKQFNPMSWIRSKWNRFESGTTRKNRDLSRQTKIWKSHINTARITKCFTKETCQTTFRFEINSWQPWASEKASRLNLSNWLWNTDGLNSRVKGHLGEWSQTQEKDSWARDTQQSRPLSYPFEFGSLRKCNLIKILASAERLTSRMNQRLPYRDRNNPCLRKCSLHRMNRFRRNVRVIHHL